MRIRQVRPEFFTDGKVSRLTVATRLTYIGLWCIADDAGWLSWDPPDIGATLYPYESVRVRERRIEEAGAALEEAGRLVVHDCGCAQIPTLEVHQRIGGNKSYTARDRHATRHVSIHSRTRPPVGSNGSEVVNSAPARDEEKPARGSLKAKVAAYGGPES